jgi:hypothetical protein
MIREYPGRMVNRIEEIIRVQDDNDRVRVRLRFIPTRERDIKLVVDADEFRVQPSDLGVIEGKGLLAKGREGRNAKRDPEKAERRTACA